MHAASGQRWPNSIQLNFHPPLQGLGAQGQNTGELGKLDKDKELIKTESQDQAPSSAFLCCRHPGAFVTHIAQVASKQGYPLQEDLSQEGASCENQISQGLRSDPLTGDTRGPQCPQVCIPGGWAWKGHYLLLRKETSCSCNRQVPPSLTLEIM